MKTINYILSLFIVFIMFGMSSCTDEDGNNQSGKKRTAQIILCAPENVIISPTKAGIAVDEKIENVCVLIYDSNGNLTTESFYDTDQGHLSVIESSTNGQSYSVELEDEGTRTVYVVANVGDKRGEWSTLGDINAVYTLGERNLPRCVLFAEGKSFSSSTTDPIIAELKRLYAKITVVVNTNGVTKGKITPTSVELKNFPTKVNVSLADQDPKMYTPSKITDNPTEGNDYISGGYSFNLGQKDGSEQVYGSHDDAASAFYMYENMQPDGYCLGDNQAYKTPYSIGSATKDPQTVSKNKTCSYIEVTTNYEGTGRGTVKYRFFLGKDPLKNFEVERNYHYKITLTLSGDGGLAEASWRVETNIMGIFTPYDAYVGYLVGSKSRVYVDLGNDQDLIKSGWTISKKTGTDVVNWNPSLSYDSDLKLHYFEVDAKETNVSDRDIQSGIYTIKSNKATETKDVKITQVIRILDPIAYYHQNTQNTFEKDVVVKVFNLSPDNFYIPLSSVGDWTVSIESGSWFTLSKHPDYAGDNTVSANNNVIKGEGGAVKFHFKAEALGSKNSARFGCISVKYHNNMCEHKIYLRQGGGDTELISGQAKWAYSNVITKGTNGTYATQPGPMFAGGNSDVLYNSYSPGYKESYDVNGKDRANWMKITGNHNSTPKQGPCPEGYTLPSIRDMSVLKKACHEANLTAAVGYIYDDDPVNGWEWDKRNGVYYAKPNDMDHSNPAKGIVLVNTSNYTNLVFPFGNGVLEHAKVSDNGMDTGLDEIGVGFRTNGKLYTEEDVKEDGQTKIYVSYNANYWSGSPGSQGNQHLSYMKFWYFLKRNVPIYLSDGSDRWGGNSTVSWFEAGGLDHNNGMFIRCVKDSKPANADYYSNKF